MRATSPLVSRDRGFAGAAVAALAVAAAVGESAQVAVGAIVSLASVALAVVAMRRAQPDGASAWWLLAGGAAAFLIGTGVAAASAGVGEVGAFPSAGDVLFVAGYGCLLLGGLRLLRYRQVDREDGDILDAVIVATAVGVVVATYVVHPYLHDARSGLIEKALTVGYATADVMLVAITVRVAVGADRRPTSYYLAAASLAAVIVTDALTTLYHFGTVPFSWVAAASPLGYVLFAAAAADPSMSQLTDRPDISDSSTLSRRRIALLFMALLLVPGLLAAHVAFDRPLKAAAVLASGSVVMAVLVVARLVGLLRGKERKVAREQVLRRTGASLVAATTGDQMYQAALDGIGRLLRGCTLTRVCITEIRAGRNEVVVAAGHRSAEAIGATVVLDPALFEPTSGAGSFGGSGEPLRRAQIRLGVAPVDVRPAEGERANVLTVSLFSRGDCCGAFLITVPGRFPVEVALAIEDLAGQLSLALESASLTDEIHRQRHERRFRVLVEHSSDLVGVLNRDGILTFVSPASSRLLGLAAADLLGRSIMERVHPHDQGKVARILGSARYAGGAADPTELRLLHSDGRWRWFEVVVNDAADEPDVRGLVVHARDVTDRKSAELRVAESEARFRSLVQNASDLVMVVGEDGAIAYVSPSVTRVLGYSAEQLLGSSWLELVARADTAHAARVVGATLPGEPSTLELRARSAAGCYVHLELIVSDLRADPVVAGLVVNARNVTERRESEERWRAFGIEASHQLRTPLTGLRLSLENLVDRPSATRAALQDALAHVDRLQSTVEDFLAIAPRRVAPVEPLDVDAVLEDIEASWRPLVLVAGRRLVVKVDGPLPVVVASAAAVRQVLGVLIDNALQHGTGCIGVAARRLVGGLALEVSDEGRGLGTPGSGPAHLNRDGNGMGLSLARALAEAEGGRLVAGRAKSSPAVALVLPSRLTYPEEGLTGRAGIRHHAQ